MAKKQASPKALKSDNKMSVAISKCADMFVDATTVSINAEMAWATLAGSILSIMPVETERTKFFSLNPEVNPEQIFRMQFLIPALQKSPREDIRSNGAIYAKYVKRPEDEEDKVSWIKAQNQSNQWRMRLINKCDTIQAAMELAKLPEKEQAKIKEKEKEEKKQARNINNKAVEMATAMVKMFDSKNDTGAKNIVGLANNIVEEATKRYKSQADDSKK